MGDEHFQAMGFTFLCDQERLSPSKGILDGLCVDEASRKRLAGNAMHDKVQGSGVAYCLGHIALPRRSSAAKKGGTH